MFNIFFKVLKIIDLFLYFEIVNMVLTWSRSHAMAGLWRKVSPRQWCTRCRAASSTGPSDGGRWRPRRRHPRPRSSRGGAALRRAPRAAASARPCGAANTTSTARWAAAAASTRSTGTTRAPPRWSALRCRGRRSRPTGPWWPARWSRHDRRRTPRNRLLQHHLKPRTNIASLYKIEYRILFLVSIKIHITKRLEIFYFDKLHSQLPFQTGLVLIRQPKYVKNHKFQAT